MDMQTGLPSKNLTLEAQTIFKNECNVDIKTTDEALANEIVLKYINSCIEKANNKAVSRAAHVRKFKIIPVDFSLIGGEYTPTMKLKRKVTEKKYKSLIEEMFEENAKL